MWSIGVFALIFIGVYGFAKASPPVYLHLLVKVRHDQDQSAR